MKTLMYMGMTLNGYIAREDDETPWPKSEFAEYYRTAKRYKATILGRRTYYIMKKGGELKHIGDPLIIVLSREGEKDEKNTVFVKSPRAALQAAKDRGIKEVIISGGGAINSAFMKENLVDELYLDVMPSLFGTGIKLFREAKFERALRLKAIRKLPDGIVQLQYRVLK